MQKQKESVMRELMLKLTRGVHRSTSSLSQQQEQYQQPEEDNNKMADVQQAVTIQVQQPDGPRFSCHNCDLSLVGHRYILRDEHPFCLKCYESLFANTCEECKTPIGTDSKV